MKAVVAVLNLKGGSGKTTVAVNLAAALGELRRRVAVLDLDPQQSATRWASQATDQGSRYFELARDVHHETGGAAAIKVTVDRLVTETDVLVLDCPPELEDRSLVAALIADLVLVPVAPSPLDLWAAEAAVKTAEEARAERDGRLPLVSLVPSRLMVGTVLARELPGSLAELGEPVAPGISQRVALAESAVAGETVVTYAPGSAGHHEFQALAAHVRKRVKT